MPQEIVVLPDPASAARTAAERVANLLDAKVREADWATVALSGGGFMSLVYEPLSHFQVPWGKVEFFFCEERCVPVDHPASSYGLAAATLFDNPRISPGQIHRIPTEISNHAEAAEVYAEELPERFDVLVLELGLDGHVASLFPGSPALDEKERLVVAVDAPMKPKRRITLTPPMLERSERRVVVAAGRERANAVQRALQGDATPREVPARLVRDSIWILDRTSASGLAK